MSDQVIPRIDVGALFCAGGNLSEVDEAILRAAQLSGMMTVHGLPRWAVLDAERRRELLAIFALPEAEIRKLWRWAFDARQPNVGSVIFSAGCRLVAQAQARRHAA